MCLGDIDQGFSCLSFLGTPSLKTIELIDNYRKLRGPTVNQVFLCGTSCLSYEDLLSISERLKHHLFTGTCEHLCHLVMVFYRKMVDFSHRHFKTEHEKDF